MFQIIEKSDRINQLLRGQETPRRIARGYYWSEGPIWNDREKALYFTDFRPNLIYRWTEELGAAIYRRNTNSACGLAFSPDHCILCAESVSRSVTKIKTDGQAAVLADHWKGMRLNSPNDLVVKSDGSIYFTDPYSPDLGLEKELRENGVYRLDRDGRLQLLASMNRPNGLAFSPDESCLYVDDTNLQQVWRYPVRGDGALGSGELFFQMDDTAGPGGADGMKLDENGNLFVTGPGGIWIISPEAEALGIVRFPEIAANLCFGGKDRSILFVTAQSSVYCLRVNTAGLRDSSQIY